MRLYVLQELIVLSLLLSSGETIDIETRVCLCLLLSLFVKYYENI